MHYAMQFGGKICLRLATSLIVVFLIAPVVIIVILSFNKSTLMLFPPVEYSTVWFRKLLGSQEWESSAVLTLQVAVLAMIFSVTTGFFASLSLIRGGYRWPTLIYGILLTPLIVPAVVTAVSFYIAFAKVGAVGSVTAMAVGHAVLALPIVVLILTGGLQTLQSRPERAAYSLGAGAVYTFFRVTLPLAKVPLASAALFAFLSSFDELLISLFLSGTQAQTLTVRIWNTLIYSIDPIIAAVSTLFIAFTCVVLLLDALLKWGKQT